MDNSCIHVAYRRHYRLIVLINRIENYNELKLVTFLKCWLLNCPIINEVLWQEVLLICSRHAHILHIVQCHELVVDIH